MSLMKSTAFLSILLLAADQSAGATNDRPSDVAAIQEVVEAFQMSIRSKDKETFVRLFHSENPERTVWQSVTEDARLARVQRTEPEKRKAEWEPGRNYLRFINGITQAAAKPQEESFRNVTVDTEGEVASVNFDYSYMAENKEKNWGREMWDLVRTGDGWKIASVIYSVRDPVLKP